MAITGDRSSLGASAQKLPKPRRRKPPQAKLARATPPVYVSTKRGREAIASLHNQAPKLWKPIDKAYRTDWLRHRLREYVNVHGYASAGVCSLLEKAAAAYADGDYIRGLAWGPEGGDLGILSHAHRLNAMGRAMELAAYEIAVREGKARHELDKLASKGVERLAHVLQETREERAAHGAQAVNRKNDPGTFFGGILDDGSVPLWPGVDGPALDQQPKQEAPKEPSANKLLLDRLQQALEPNEFDDLDQEYAAPKQPRGASGKFINPGEDPEDR